MSTELDPLLPQNEPAPEISGNGYDWMKKRRNDYQTHVGEDTENDKDAARDVDSSSAGASPLRTIVAMFISVVGLGLLISFVLSDGFHGKWRLPQSPIVPNNSLTARVDKILSENPLFGIYILLPSA